MSSTCARVRGVRLIDAWLTLACWLWLPDTERPRGEVCDPPDMDDVADSWIGVVVDVATSGAVVVARGDTEAMLAGGVHESSARRNACTSSLSGAPG
jgi:hypothetical protein